MKLRRRNSSGVKPNRSRHFVHVSLQGKDALRRAESTKRTVRRDVRRHRSTLDAHVRTKIRTRRVNRAARKHHWRQRAVRAAVDHKIYLLRQQFAIFGHAIL